ncbi:MAG: PIN domain-containing protein [Methanobrevibacter sp.]|nr:PIN domain-containing protein [Methanobrevibacter sp.]
MILVDSNFFISLMNDKDQYHEKAKKLANDIMKENNKIVHLLMVSEAIASIAKRKNGEIANKLYNVIVDNFEIYYPKKEDIEESMELVLKYGGNLSLADCLAIQIMKKRKIINIFSFDDDFDTVNGIIRIH